MLDTIFSAANGLALFSWVAQLFSPFAPVLVGRFSGLAVPLLFSAAYAALIVAFWSGARGGFSSLNDVQTLFASRELLLAGWLHYLAFDLFVGSWIARTARESGMPFVLVIPCLALTFLFGPCGFLLFNMLRAGRRLAGSGSGFHSRGEPA